MSIRIITDSTSDLTSEHIDRLDIDVVPLTVHFGEEEYTDGIDLTKDDFYKKLPLCQQLPTTSQATVGNFISVFEKALAKNDEILGLFLSADLSGTYQSAMIAKETLVAADKNKESKIHIIDSRSVTLGLSALIYEAIKMRDKGMVGIEIAKALETIKGKLRVLAYIDQLKYLQKGGRLSASSAAIGTLLSIKPIVEVSHGKIAMLHKSRGKKNAYKFIIDSAKESKIDRSRAFIYGHSHCEDELKIFKETADKELKIVKSDTLEIGIVVGTHSGPGAVGMAYFTV